MQGTPFDPVSPFAASITGLTYILLGIATVILAIVTGFVVYNAWRFRAKPGDGEPKQVHGNPRLETGWTLGVVAVLIVIFFFTFRAAGAADPSKPDRQPDFTVIAHQWWWEVHYPQGNVVTANEIHIPTGKQLLVELKSDDVIHDFWVPPLGRKMDIIPGQPNRTWIEADQSGTFLGACAEFCGAEHAWMRIRVIAQPQSEFNAWLQQQAQAAPHPNGGAAAQGALIFQQQTCASCHAIRGTSANGNVGPNLTHVASRATLGAGVLENTPDNLARWLRATQEVKPGALMPNMKLSNEQIRQLVTYLETLK